MKFRPIPAVIALLLGGLVCYGYLACGVETVMTVIATVVALLFLVSVLGIGQLILEGIKGKQWVHVSTRVPSKASNRVITITDKGAQLGIQELP